MGMRFVGMWPISERRRIDCAWVLVDRFAFTLGLLPPERWTVPTEIEAALETMGLIYMSCSTLYSAAAGLVGCNSASGEWLYRFFPHSPHPEPSVERPASFAFSFEALGDLDAAYADIDWLLAGIEIEPGN